METLILDDNRVKVLTFSSYFLPGYKGGGPIRTIDNLVTLATRGVSYSLITKDRDLGDNTPYSSVRPGEWNQLADISVFYSEPGVKGLLQIFRSMVKKNYDLVYLNSFFSVRFSFFPLLIARLLGKRIVLGPRGEFSTGALNLKTFKKRLFLFFYKLLWLHKGVVFQASSSFEAKDIHRTIGKTVDVRIAEDIASQEFAISVASKDEVNLKAVFVSRISPKKNLLGAIEMLAKVGVPLIYDIYGPIEDQHYWGACQEKIRALPSNVQVNYKGPLSPHEVIKTISGYDVFFMPTKGENFGHVIAEALCAGLPLLIADTTPWRGLPAKGLGWDLPLADQSAFVSIIEELAAVSVEEHLKMRKNVLAWAKHKFSQCDAIEANIAMFRYAVEKHQ